MDSYGWWNQGSSSSKICRYSRGKEISDISVPCAAVDGLDQPSKQKKKQGWKLTLNGRTTSHIYIYITYIYIYIIYIYIHITYIYIYMHIYLWWRKVGEGMFKKVLHWPLKNCPACPTRGSRSGASPRCPWQPQRRRSFNVLKKQRFGNHRENREDHSYGHGYWL